MKTKEQVTARLNELRELAKKYERDPGMGAFKTTVSDSIRLLEWVLTP